VLWHKNSILSVKQPAPAILKAGESGGIRLTCSDHRKMAIKTKTNLKIVELVNSTNKHSHAVKSGCAAHSEFVHHNHQLHCDALYDHRYNDVNIYV